MQSGESEFQKKRSGDLEVSRPKVRRVLSSRHESESPKRAGSLVEPWVTTSLLWFRDHAMIRLVIRVRGLYESPCLAVSMYRLEVRDYPMYYPKALCAMIKPHKITAAARTWTHPGESRIRCMHYLTFSIHSLYIGNVFNIWFFNTTLQRNIDCPFWSGHTQPSV